jgi:hypothetical protein
MTGQRKNSGEGTLPTLAVNGEAARHHLLATLGAEFHGTVQEWASALTVGSCRGYAGS